MAKQADPIILHKIPILKTLKKVIPKIGLLFIIQLLSYISTKTYKLYKIKNFI